MNKALKILGITIVLLVVIIVVLPAIMNSETETLNSEIRAGIPGEFIELTQGFTHYEEAGADTAQTVLLVHGFSSPYYIWDPTFEALKESGFRVIRFDLYGRGYSDRPLAEYNKEFYAKQIEDLLMALNIQEPIDILGLSMGGPISAEFAVRYPEKVNKLVLIDPVHECVDISVLKTPGIGEYVMNVYFAPSMKKTQLDVFYNPEAFTDLTAKFLPQTQYKGFKRAILLSLRNYMNEDKLPVYTKLGQLNKPVLLVWGEEDQKVPYNGNERVREVMECKFLSIEEAGHLPHYEKPELVNPGIIEFLNTKL